MLGTCLLYQRYIVVSLFSEKLTYCRSLWINPNCKCILFSRSSPNPTDVAPVIPTGIVKLGTLVLSKLFQLPRKQIKRKTHSVTDQLKTCIQDSFPRCFRRPATADRVNGPSCSPLSCWGLSCFVCGAPVFSSALVPTVC